MICIQTRRVFIGVHRKVPSIDDNAFEFNVFANDIVQAEDERVLTLARQFQKLSTSITSLALNLNSKWPPGVTLPNFNTRTHELAS
ncbi:hypothetical protein ACA910_020246 [Epithemia clementina (nom. ined.)]